MPTEALTGVLIGTENWLSLGGKFVVVGSNKKNQTRRKITNEISAFVVKTKLIEEESNLGVWLGV